MASDKKKRPYGFDRGEEAAQIPRPDPPAEPKPGLPLADEDDPGPAAEPGPEPTQEIAPEPASVRALDVCPNCGSPLGAVDFVVCLRCGFDLKTLKVIKTETGETTVPESSDDDGEKPVLCGPGVGDHWLPATMAGLSLVLLAAGYIAGSGGLVTVLEGEEAVGFGAKMAGLFKMLLRTGLLAVAGVGGLAGLAQVLSARLGDVKLAAVRMVGITATIGLLSYFDLNSTTLEWIIETLTQALAFLGLTMVLFRLKARDAATLLGITAFAVIALLIVTALVYWALTPGRA